MKGAVILIIVLVGITAIGLMLSTHWMQEITTTTDKDVQEKLFHWVYITLCFGMIALGICLLTLPRLSIAL